MTAAPGPGSPAAAETSAVLSGPAARRGRVRALVAERGLDALVVTDLVNIRYLTGFTGSNALVILGADPAVDVFVTDPRYVVQAARQVPDLERVVEPALPPAAARHLAARWGSAGAGATVGVETHVVTVDQYEVLRSLIGGSGATLAPAGRCVEAVRTVKDDGELEDLQAACAVSVAALADLVSGARGPLGGRSEREVADALDELLLDHGAEGLSFDTIVASGANSASPHHEPGSTPLAPGDLVVVDFGATVHGYHADMTRTLHVRGPGAEAPEPWQRQIHGLVRRAAAAGRAAAVADADVAAVDSAARSLIAGGGHGQHFTHGLGHGVGLVIHEDPFLGPGRTGTLARGVPVTIEPGIYLTGRGGVRIEDTVVVGGPAAPRGPATPDGTPGGNGPAVLTEFSRELLEVD